MTLRIALVFAIVLLAGCAGAGKMESQPLTAGNTFVLKAPNDRVKRAAREALTHAKFEVTDERQVDADTYWVLGMLGMSMQSHGQWARVVVKRVSDGESRVWINTVKRIEMNITENIYITRQAVQKYMGELVQLYEEDDKDAARRRR